MATDSESLAHEEVPAAHVLRGRIQFASADAWGPTMSLGIAVLAMIGGLSAGGFVLASSGRALPDGVGTAVGGTAVLAAIFLFVVVRGVRGMQDELQIFDDRIVFHACRRMRSGVRFTILFDDLEHLTLERSWIRMRRKDGRRMSFKASRLQVGDAYDLLEEKVDAKNGLDIISTS